ncbi:hypothetical protein EDB95_4792 [Dinghuibacter silviterrae]|uniref:Uncharacterized protein n=2 Tax=Dinghuibacter silviterrae TaxID=1539049 RepID=A0A4R8DIG5_9BACT|nr:hypothetical protein EDB95_4792 [Dinghuibacter silviterrae]
MSGTRTAILLGFAVVLTVAARGQNAVHPRFAPDPRLSVYQYAVTEAGCTAYLWIPERCRFVRGIIIALSNLTERDWLEDSLIRKTAADEGLGIAWVSLGKNATITADMDKASGRALEQLLDDLADASGYTEIATAPLLPMGHSAHGHFAWTVAKWNPGRTIATIPFKTIPWPDSLGFKDVPVCYIVGQTTEWPQYRVPDPATQPGDRDFYWPVVTRGAVALRSADEHNLVGVVTDAGGGHFDWNDRLARFVALYIRKACAYRLPPAPAGNDGAGASAAAARRASAPALLRAIAPGQGWLTDTGGMSPDRYPPAPYKKYQGDPRKAFWFFDEETARAAAAFEGDRKQRARQMPTFVQDGDTIDPAKTGYAPLKFEPGEDGLTFTVRGAFLDKMPRELLGSGTTLGHADGPIRFEVITGPAEQTGPNTFRVRFNRDGIGGDIWLLAWQPGDEQYRWAVQPGKIHLPDGPNESGRITFPKIKGQKLEATSDNGRPVYYYVDFGPAYIKGDSLILTKIPPRSRYPVAVTVTAYQWGRTQTPLYQTAEPVTQTIYIEKTHQ